MTQPAVRSFLANFEKTPTTRKHVAKVLRLIMGEAVAAGWRTDNPVQGIRIRLPKTPKLAIWEQSDVDAYSAEATLQGRHSVAAMIILVWEIGQRLTDLQQFKAGIDYDAGRGVFSFAQSKTGAQVTIAVSSMLRGVLADLCRSDGEALFLDEATGNAFDTYRLSHEFRRVRTAVERAGGRGLVLRQLRHSCVIQLARAGCTVPEIASITGHTFGSVNGILSTYLPRDGTVARNAQIKRGLIPQEDRPDA
ncbi:tyrosine-type recombinase/integrase [Brevundimonas goettingensis]|uniref:Tyrosine-type recombinase/integrase n=1 Tax=Brevundimonas goettingensis TaxID=2774190 RepID=A0A975C106_9CAUL|nr:tyrosine-type recombinase/integrase [Brevundimonas goettingensis]QTC90439.1 tyrosine-type recombinase/integrase [Brevundimonas goettingensis]